MTSKDAGPPSAALLADSARRFVRRRIPCPSLLLLLWCASQAQAEDKTQLQHKHLFQYMSLQRWSQLLACLDLEYVGGNGSGICIYDLDAAQRLPLAIYNTFRFMLKNANVFQLGKNKGFTWSVSQWQKFKAVSFCFGAHVLWQWNSYCYPWTFRFTAFENKNLK